MTKSWRDYHEQIINGDERHNNVKMWSQRAPLCLLVANNEQKPYSETETGEQMLPMPPKKQLGFQQTGDYIGYLLDYDMATGVGWERKTVDDLYSTLIHDRDRFYAECERALGIFDYLLIGAECSEKRFLNYRPKGEKGAYRNSRYALIRELAPMFNYRVQILFCGNRKNAAKRLAQENRLWLKYNYERVIKNRG